MENQTYREGANAIVIDKDNNFMLVQKQNYGKGQWDFPGGGLEENEDPRTGVLRELEEELGTKDFKIIKKSPYINQFEWPKEAREHGFKKHGNWWKGQKKYQFIVKFTGNKKDITFQKEEIRKIKWVPYNELEKHLVFENQWNKANKAIEEANIGH